MSQQSHRLLLEISNLTKYYFAGGEKITALNSIFLALPLADLAGVAGPSGSGKSTLLNIIGALDSPDEGSVVLDGEPVNYEEEKQLENIRQNKISFIFQNFNLIPVLTASENVELALMTGKLQSMERKERANDALEMVGLSNRRHHFPNQLSGGQQQRVSVARAFVKKPALILADEPTANLDGVNAHKLIDIIERVNEDNGTSFLISTHDKRVLDRLSHIIQLEDGVII